MQKKTPDLSMDIYHRIYRFATRNISAERIAVTLGLPMTTVKRALERLASVKDGTVADPIVKSVIASEPSTYLDIRVSAGVKYVSLDFDGSLTSEHCDKIEQELTKAAESDWRTVALVTRGVKVIDEAGLKQIIEFHEKFVGVGRFSAILDPSPVVEEFISKNNVESRIQIFGTEKAFLTGAFETKDETKKR